MYLYKNPRPFRAVSFTYHFPLITFTKYKRPQNSVCSAVSMVRAKGLEPLCIKRRILNPVRLPVPPRSHDYFII